MGVGAADSLVACWFAEARLSGQPLKVARGMLWGQATTDHPPPRPNPHGWNIVGIFPCDSFFNVQVK